MSATISRADLHHVLRSLPPPSPRPRPRPTRWTARQASPALGIAPRRCCGRCHFGFFLSAGRLLSTAAAFRSTGGRRDPRLGLVLADSFWTFSQRPEPLRDCLEVCSATDSTGEDRELRSRCIEKSSFRLRKKDSAHSLPIPTASSLASLAAISCAISLMRRRTWALSMDSEKTASAACRRNATRTCSTVVPSSSEYMLRRNRPRTECRSTEGGSFSATILIVCSRRVSIDGRGSSAKNTPRFISSAH